jgi:hypothetical protein
MAAGLPQIALRYLSGACSGPVGLSEATETGPVSGQFILLGLDGACTIWTYQIISGVYVFAFSLSAWAVLSSALLGMLPVTT